MTHKFILFLKHEITFYPPAQVLFLPVLIEFNLITEDIVIVHEVIVIENVVIIHHVVTVVVKLGQRLRA